MTDKVEIIKKACEDKLGKDMDVLKVGNLTNIADYFIVVTGNTKNHTQAIADEIEEQIEKAGYELRGREGFREGDWILLDADDVIVHVFTQDTREYYNLERLWRED